MENLTSYTSYISPKSPPSPASRPKTGTSPAHTHAAKRVTRSPVSVLSRHAEGGAASGGGGGVVPRKISQVRVSLRRDLQLGLVREFAGSVEMGVFIAQRNDCTCIH